MPEETLLTAARRIVRFIRIDDEKDGGLLSQKTLSANETLAKMIGRAEREEKRRQTEADLSAEGER